MLAKLGEYFLHTRILAQALIYPVAYAVGGAVFDGQNRVLLARHTYKPGWQFPLGGVDRGEAAPAAVMRELHEEVGLVKGTASLFGVYTRRGGLATNIIAFYRIDDAEVSFRRNHEISEIMFADLSAPPPGCTEDTLRRLRELAGGVALDPFW